MSGRLARCSISGLRTLKRLASICVAAAGVSLILQRYARPAVLSPLRFAPAFTANKLSILARLRHKQFAELDSEFERYHADFERNAAKELNEKLAFDSFATDDESVRDLIAEWIKQRPGSYVAQMAMGSYWSWRGWHTRGPAVASQTPEKQFELMREYFGESVANINAALKIRPDLTTAYAVLIGEARGEADRARVRALKAQALGRAPASFLVREQVIESLYPRWGGSREEMAEFADESQGLVKENPCLRWLLGFVELDEGETLGIHAKYVESIAALTRAIERGGEYSGFYLSRGIGYAYTSEYEKALADLNRADELWPQDPELLSRRAWVLAKLNRPDEVLADLDLVKTFEKPDEYWTHLHDLALKEKAAQH